MNTVPDLQPEDRAQLLANNVERQKLRARQREIQARLEELDQQDNEILTKAERTEHEESESMLDLSKFTYVTQLLLAELRDAPNSTLSKDAIRLYVIGNEDAPDETVRTVIYRAREEMEAFPDCRHRIETVRRVGYRFVCKESFQNVSNPKKTRKKQRK